MPPSLDPQAVALAKAIRQTESGGDFNARGQSGEIGAYQFTPATWAGASKKYLGRDVPLDRATPQEQNEVVYKRIKEWKDAGRNVGQIASMWNAGEGRPNAYVENWRGTNSLGVSFDTPAYAEKVAKAYQKIKAESGLGVAQAAGAPSSLHGAIADYRASKPEVPRETEQGDPSLMQDLGQTASEFGSKIKDVTGKTLSGEINPLSGLWQGAGAVVGGLGDATTDVARHIPVVGGLVRGLESAIGKGVEAAAGTELGQKAIGGIQKFAEAHPEAAGNIGAGVDIVSALPALKGAQFAKNAVKGGVGRVLHGKADDVYDAVSRPLSGKRLADAVATRGTVRKGLLGRIEVKPDPRDLKVADAVRANVPGFRPGAEAVRNIDEIQKTVDGMADALEREVKLKGAGRIYSYRELEANLRKIEMPDVIAAEPYLRNLHDRLIRRAVAIAKAKGGKVENLLDVRKEFDRLVARQYPNIYNSLDRTSPLKESVLGIRDALTDFTVKALPEDVALRESLLTQHRLIRAIENLSESASVGGAKEIGTTRLQRFGQRHPVIKGVVTGGLKAGAAGLGIGGATTLFGRD